MENGISAGARAKFLDLNMTHDDYILEEQERLDSRSRWRSSLIISSALIGSSAILLLTFLPIWPKPVLLTWPEEPSIVIYGTHATNVWILDEDKQRLDYRVFPATTSTQHYWILSNIFYNQDIPIKAKAKTAAEK